MTDDSEYFAERNSERRAQLRAELDAAAGQLEGIVGALRLSDQELAERIHALGFTGDSARVFDLMPLVHVAWADGKIQRNERATILAIVDQRGIERDSDAFLLMEALLEQRPSETFLGETLAILQALLDQKPEEGASLVDLCLSVAAASGGLLGLGAKTSAEERELIERVADALGDGAKARFRERLSG